MQGFIQQFNNLNLNNIGDPNFAAGQKLQDIQELSRTDYNVAPFDGPINTNQCFDIALPNLVAFNNEWINLGHFIDTFYTNSQHGLLDVGSYYTKYINLRNNIPPEVNRIHNLGNINDNQKRYF